MTIKELKLNVGVVPDMKAHLPWSVFSPIGRCISKHGESGDSLDLSSDMSYVTFRRGKTVQIVNENT